MSDDDPIKRAEKAEAMNRHWQKQSVECWQAFSAMRDSINEVLPMPSVESDLLRGPEFSVSCEAVALAVSGHVSALQAELTRLRADLANAGAVMVEAAIEHQRWRQMDTAPRDGTWFYAMTASGYTRKVHYADHHDRLPICDAGEVWSTLPILWRALTPDATAALSSIKREAEDAGIKIGLRAAAKSADGIAIEDFGALFGSDEDMIRRGDALALARDLFGGETVISQVIVAFFVVIPPVALDDPKVRPGDDLLRLRAEAAESAYTELCELVSGEDEKVRALVEAAIALNEIVEGISGVMDHGVWRDERGVRLKDTPEWVALYNARAALRDMEGA